MIKYVTLKIFGEFHLNMGERVHSALLSFLHHISYIFIQNTQLEGLKTIAKTRQSTGSLDSDED